MIGGPINIWNITGVSREELQNLINDDNLQIFTERFKLTDLSRNFITSFKYLISYLNDQFIDELASICELRCSMARQGSIVRVNRLWRRSSKVGILTGNERYRTAVHSPKDNGVTYKAGKVRENEKMQTGMPKFVQGLRKRGNLQKIRLLVDEHIILVCAEPSSG